MKKDLLNNKVFQMAASQFDRTADFLNLDASVRERCKWPKRLITVTVAIQRDNGETEVFFGYRVQHHHSRGPVKGGLRFHPDVNLGEVAALAMWMNWKCALMDLPYGGGKGGVTVSYFEWVQNLQRYQWTVEEVLSKLETKLETAFEKVLLFTQKNDTPHRVSALALGIAEVASTKSIRGLFP